MKITEEDVVAFKEETTRLTKHMIDTYGGLPPCLIVLVEGNTPETKKDKKTALVCPIPEEAMVNSDTKHNFVTQCMPILVSNLKESNLIPLYIAFCTEAWIRKFKPEGGINNFTMPDNWRDFPKTEVVLMSFDGPYGAQMDIYEIERGGLMVTEENKLVDGVKLIKMEEEGKPTTEGVFANLYERFFKDK